jgi:hypothetical protein
MSVAQIAPGRAMMLAPGRAALWRPFGNGAAGINTGVGSFPGPYPSAIAGLTGWWDAGSYAGIVDGNNNPLPGWNNAVGGIVDKSGNGNTLVVYSYAANNIPPQATPRLNGTLYGSLGGVGRNTALPPAVPNSGYLLPQMDPDSGLSLASAQVGAGSPWTVYLVWSRPNFAQGVGAPQTALLTGAGTILLAADALPGVNQRLVLFPGSAPAVLTNSLERRHTHSIIIRNTPGSGVDAWLDGTQVATGIANPTPTSLSGALLFLHGGSTAAGAQCWFHEAALWSHALAVSDITTLLSAAERWSRGARKGVQLVVMGQSNAGYALGDGAWHLLAQGIAWHLGALAYNVIASYDGGSSYTCVGGHGISNVPFSGTVLFQGYFLADPEDGSDPAGWPLGSDGTAVQTYLGSQAAIDLADISLLVWPWSESDSARPYNEKAFYGDAARNLLARTRGMLSRSPASLPLMWWNAIPFGSGANGGIQMVREVAAAIAADPTQHVFIGLPQTSDSNPRGASWNPATGVSSGGDFNHRDVTDNLRFGRLAAPVAARAILAATGGDTQTAMPSGIPTVGGPSITHVYQAVANSTTLIVTITHDAGDDLIVPLLAAIGQGFAVMDGGSVVAPGPIITATGCTRIDATHLQITLATAPTNPPAALLLFYPYGYGNIFRGDAVTDNFASVVKPAGWDIGADLGSSWTLNFPLAATTTPIAISATP